MNLSLKRIRRRIRYWRDADARRRLLQEEMDVHVEALARDLAEGGLSEADARAAAHRRFGNITLQAEDSRGTWISRWLSDALQDLRYTARNLRRDAGFAIFATLIVGLGIGASATVFSIVNALLLRPLPFRDPARLVWIANQASRPEQTHQVGHLLDLAGHSSTVSGIAGYYFYYRAGDVRLTSGGSSQRLTGVKVTQNFFPLLGVQPLLGRNFTLEECRRHWDDIPAVLLSYNLWERRFASDPAIVGRKLMLNEQPAMVAGVLPASFDLATVFAPGARVDLYLPFPMTGEADSRGNTLSAFGRLRPGATVEAAQAEFTSMGAELQRKHPDRNDLQPRLSMLAQHVNGRLRPAIFVLICAVGVVMLIVCANLSNLQLARTASRRKEMAVRVALGAGRNRLIRQMLTESLVLASGGALLGIALAIAGTRVLASLDAINIPLLASVRVDLTALLFTLLAAVSTGILFGLMPALQIPALAVHDTLKDSSRGSSEGRKRAWVRGALAVAEIALACVLLVGAGLLIRSFLRVLDIDLGFHPESAAAMRIDPSARYTSPEMRNNYYTDALNRVRSIPGVNGAGLTDVLPLGGDRSWGVCGKGQLCDRNHYYEAFVRIISDGYFHAMGIALKAGRDFSERDTAKSAQVIVLNESFAHAVWPNQSAIGQVIRGAGNVDREVVGVVGDVRHQALEQTSGNEMYLPIRQTGDYEAVDLVVRGSLAPAQLSGAVRAALKPLDPELPANEFRTVQQLVDKATSPRRFIVYILSGFSAFAVLLAALGIYGVISYSVSQRTQEIGIRMALGASAGNVQRRVILQTMALAGVGMAMGVSISWIAARGISGLLYGISAADPVTFVGMLAMLTAVACIAGYLPARRASRIDPIEALRAM